MSCATQVPLFKQEPQSKSATSQWSPDHPTGHEHVFGEIHAPPFWQGDLHEGDWQLRPSHPPTQIHVLGLLQNPPFLQPPSHTGVSQVLPEYPVPEQSHWLGPTHAPLFMHFNRQIAIEQSVPVQPSQHSSTSCGSLTSRVT
jgi:hypothetical protein